jgi:hypothetical protein
VSCNRTVSLGASPVCPEKDGVRRGFAGGDVGEFHRGGFPGMGGFPPRLSGTYLYARKRDAIRTIVTEP